MHHIDSYFYLATPRYLDVNACLNSILQGSLDHLVQEVHLEIQVQLVLPGHLVEQVHLVLLDQKVCLDLLDRVAILVSQVLLVIRVRKVQLEILDQQVLLDPLAHQVKELEEMLDLRDLMAYQVRQVRVDQLVSQVLLDLKVPQDRLELPVCVFCDCSISESTVRLEEDTFHLGIYICFYAVVRPGVMKKRIKVCCC